MRISDWSSDVCSSDLRLGRPLPRCDAQEKGGGEEGMSDRYTDKPFLRYVDAWVLNAIGALDEPTRAYCVAMEPQLRQGLGKTGNWDAIVAQQMNFPPELPDQIDRKSTRLNSSH